MVSWKWSMDQLPEKNGLKVFSCFSCGGGSSFGYKLAGYEVIGNCEIDPAINRMYLKNHHPRHNFLMDIRDFNKLEDLPEELYQLDVLDGSPPCSTFSMAGKRQEGWGVEKQFREGQKMQRLDDLFFDFLDTVEKLQPKVVVAENVEGLVIGRAKGYVTEIVNRFKELGYDVQLFKLNSKYMGVPQERIRVFFIANRCGFKPLKLDFRERPIVFGKVKSGDAIYKMSQDEVFLLSNYKPGDRKLSHINERVRGKVSRFNASLIWDNRVCNTLASGSEMYRCDSGRWGKFNDDDYRNIQTFPQDYDFDGNEVKYVCGMSVPPLMMHRIAEQIKKQWFGDINAKEKNSLDR